MCISLIRQTFPVGNLADFPRATRALEKMRRRTALEKQKLIPRIKSMAGFSTACEFARAKTHPLAQIH
jgi:hypothetical protein